MGAWWKYALASWKAFRIAYYWIGQSDCYLAKAGIVRTIALAATIAIACGPLWMAAGAADFSHAKRTFVPATAFDRRVDFTTMKDYQAVSSSVPLQARKSTGNISVSPRSGSSAAKAKSSVPPPPSLTAQLKRAISTPQAQQAIASMRKRAVELVQSGKFEDAKQVAARVLTMSPQDKTVLRSMAVGGLDKAKQYVQSNDFDKALQYARESLAYDGNNVEAKKVVDGLLLKAGLDPNNADERLKTADLLLSQGKNDEAFVEYQSALKLKPNAQAHVGIGNVALRAGQKERAKSEYHSAIDIEPNSALAYRQLGLLKLSSGDVVGANAALSRALVLNPSDKNASKSLIDLWQQQVSKVPGANSHLGLARAYQLSGDLANAQNEYRTVVQLDPQNPHLPAARQSFKLALARQQAQRALEAGKTLDAAGATQEAYGKVLEAVRLSPGDSNLRVYQGDLLAKLERYPAARDAYLNALKIDPRHSMAAERLKALPPDTVTIAPELAIPPGHHVMGTPGATGVAGASNGALQHAGLIPTADPVQNISNFALALRNHIVVQKSQMQQAEDAAHAALQQLGSPASEVLATATPSAGGAALGAGAASGAASSATSTDGVSDVLSSAAAAIAAAKGLTHPGSTPVAPAAAGSSASAATPASGTSASPAASSAGALPKPLQKLSNLHQQNQALQSQLKNMRDSLAKLRGKATPASDATPAASSPAGSAPATAVGAVGAVGAVSGATPTQSNVELDNILGVRPSAPVAVGVDEPPVAPSIAQTLAAQQGLGSFSSAGSASSGNVGSSGNIGNGLRAMAPEIDPNGSMPYSAQLAPPPPFATAVRLELMNASPKLGAVELAVALRNDADTPLSLNGNKYKAVINYTNRHPANVSVTFGDVIVPPHGYVKGLIKVPFDKVDPTADLVIPDLLPAGSSARDVHLITSVALR